jgi:hypothetical protein
MPGAGRNLSGTCWERGLGGLAVGRLGSTAEGEGGRTLWAGLLGLSYPVRELPSTPFEACLASTARAVTAAIAGGAWKGVWSD